MTNILSSDILIVDAITELKGNKKLQELVEKKEFLPGGKYPLTMEEFQEFSAAIAGHPVTFTPGGSAANTLTTLSKLMGGEINSEFIGVIGKSLYSQMIKDGLDEARVKLIPENFESEIRPESAVSFVIVYPDGQRAIATYPGNAKNVLKPEVITDEIVDKADVVFVQGSLWQKFGGKNHTGHIDAPFPNRLMELRWLKNKELWLAMPTHAEFGKEAADLFQYLIPSANLILANDEELARIYKTTPEAALKRLQETFRNERILQNHGRLKRKQVGFITQGEYGAAVVTENYIIHVDPIKIDKKDIKNTVGAGDTSFAGFALGYLKGLPEEVSAQIAMALAGEKLKINQARLPDPRATLAGALPVLSKKIFGPKSAISESSGIAK